MPFSSWTKTPTSRLALGVDRGSPAFYQAEGGTTVAEVCRILGVTEQTFSSIFSTAGSASFQA